MASADVTQGQRQQDRQPAHRSSEHDARHAGVILHVHEEEDNQAGLADGDGQRHNSVEWPEISVGDGRGEGGKR